MVSQGRDVAISPSKCGKMIPAYESSVDFIFKIVSGCFEEAVFAPFEKLPLLDPLAKKAGVVGEGL